MWQNTVTTMLFLFLVNINVKKLYAGLVNLQKS